MGKNEQDSMIWVDPARVRFQHARIRPFFSSCGRSLEETLDSIRNMEITAADLPPIQVIVGPETEDGPWYFSLNNRRLWVLKRCREEGLLNDTNNQIQVRVRAPKSKAEASRYKLENCAIEAKLMRETGDHTKGSGRSKNSNKQKKKQESTNTQQRQSDEECPSPSNDKDGKDERKDDDDSDSSDDDDDDDKRSSNLPNNRFSALF